MFENLRKYNKLSKKENEQIWVHIEIKSLLKRRVGKIQNRSIRIIIYVKKDIYRYWDSIKLIDENTIGVYVLNSWFVTGKRFIN